MSSGAKPDLDASSGRRTIVEGAKAVESLRANEMLGFDWARRTLRGFSCHCGCFGTRVLDGVDVSPEPSNSVVVSGYEETFETTLIVSSTHGIGCSL